jgi:hypothetical protein
MTGAVDRLLLPRAASARLFPIRIWFQPIVMLPPSPRVILTLPVMRSPACMWSSAQFLSRRTACFRARPTRFHGRGNAPARAKIAAHDGPYWVARFHHVFQDLIDDIFLEYSEVAIAEEIFLVRPQFQTLPARHVAQRNHAEVGQSRFRANRSELRAVDDDLVSRKLVRPGFDCWKFEIQASHCMSFRIAWLRFLRRCHGVNSTKKSRVEDGQRAPVRACDLPHAFRELTASQSMSLNEQLTAEITR